MRVVSIGGEIRQRGDRAQKPVQERQLAVLLRMTKWRQGDGQPVALLVRNASEPCHIKNVLFLTDRTADWPAEPSFAQPNLKDFRI